MSDGIMFLIAIFGIIIGTFFLYLINKGIELCKENNSLGVLLLFFTLNIFGLIFGCCIISNLRYKEKKHYILN
ncbi:hypothetical protein [Spiroplasma endosymbiont of Zeiraphera isertana]|uniref:hypothetical protein n=1 Tax=Spiroplasma endosymbiont of Zeiraphera isertana TaxID=3066313 RepID=UPI00313AF502